jgi:hypothetical protein
MTAAARVARGQDCPAAWRTIAVAGLRSSSPTSRQAAQPRGAPATAAYIAAAVELIAADGYRLLPDYRFDPRTGLWRHAAGPPRPQITLSDVGYDSDGQMSYPRRHGRAGEEAFPDYLRQARAILAARPAHLDDGPTGLPPDFEALRWFPLPPACLQGQLARPAGPG